jgi:multicomponent Na+:H+ antiporter subunit G
MTAMQVATDWATALLMVTGALLMLVSAIGVARMPDLFTRMQASTKAASLGAGLMLLGVAVHFAQLGITMRVLLIISFVFLTAPISAHMIARASYFVGVPLWGRTSLDELRNRYNPRSHTLESTPDTHEVAPAAEGGSSATSEGRSSRR